VETDSERNVFDTCVAIYQNVGFRLLTGKNRVINCETLLNLSSGIVIGGSGTPANDTVVSGGTHNANLSYNVQLANAANCRISDLSCRSLGVTSVGMIVSTTNGYNLLQDLDLYDSGRFDGLSVSDTTTIIRDVVRTQNFPHFREGTGSPEGSIVAPVGSTYRRIDGGTSTSFYVKESGTGNTGWVAK